MDQMALLFCGCQMWGGRGASGKEVMPHPIFGECKKHLYVTILCKFKLNTHCCLIGKGLKIELGLAV